MAIVFIPTVPTEFKVVILGLCASNLISWRSPSRYFFENFNHLDFKLLFKAGSSLRVPRCEFSLRRSPGHFREVGGVFVLHTSRCDLSPNCHHRLHWSHQIWPVVYISISRGRGVTLCVIRFQTSCHICRGDTVFPEDCGQGAVLKSALVVRQSDFFPTHCQGLAPCTWLPAGPSLRAGCGQPFLKQAGTQLCVLLQCQLPAYQVGSLFWFILYSHLVESSLISEQNVLMNT